MALSLNIFIPNNNNNNTVDKIKILYTSFNIPSPGKYYYYHN